MYSVCLLNGEINQSVVLWNWKISEAGFSLDGRWCSGGFVFKSRKKRNVEAFGAIVFELLRRNWESRKIVKG
jgi:hypothetical protein